MGEEDEASMMEGGWLTAVASFGSLLAGTALLYVSHRARKEREASAAAAAKPLSASERKKAAEAAGDVRAEVSPYPDVPEEPATADDAVDEVADRRAALPAKPPKLASMESWATASGQSIDMRDTSDDDDDDDDDNDDDLTGDTPDAPVPTLSMDSVNATAMEIEGRVLQKGAMSWRDLLKAYPDMDRKELQAKFTANYRDGTKPQARSRVPPITTNTTTATTTTTKHQSPNPVPALGLGIGSKPLTTVPTDSNSDASSDQSDSDYSDSDSDSDSESNDDDDDDAPARPAGVPALGMGGKKPPGIPSLGLGGAKPAGVPALGLAMKKPAIPALGAVSGGPPGLPKLGLLPRTGETAETPRAPRAFDLSTLRDGNPRDNEVEASKRRKLEENEGVCAEITPFLYLGSKTVASDREILRDNGITHVVNTAVMVCDNYFESDNALTYLSLGLADAAHEDIMCCIYKCIAAIDRAKSDDGKTFVHCWQGVSRSSTVCIAYLMLHDQSLEFNDALMHVRKTRPVARPNIGFQAQLLEWKMRMKAPPKKRLVYRIEALTDEDPTLVPRIQHREFDADSASVLIIQGKGPYLCLWVGKDAATAAVDAARAHTALLQKYENAGDLVVVNETQEPADFDLTTALHTDRRIMK